MVMYSLVHKLLQNLKINQNPKEIILWSKGKSNSKSKINRIMKWKKIISHTYLSFNCFRIYEAHHKIS
jgi:hypothetical protein